MNYNRINEFDKTILSDWIFEYQNPHTDIFWNSDIMSIEFANQLFIEHMHRMQAFGKERWQLPINYDITKWYCVKEFFQMLIISELIECDMQQSFKNGMIIKLKKL